MKILITGGCGFVGTVLASSLERLGHDIHVVDNFSRAGSRGNQKTLSSLRGVAVTEVDICDRDAMFSLVARYRPEVIVHLAAQVAMTTSLEKPLLDFEVNAGGTVNLLEAMRRSVPDALLIFSSTNKVYGDLESLAYEELTTRHKALDYPFGVDETFPVDFHSPYGCSKGAADSYVYDYARIYGLNTVVLRHSTIYGSSQRATVDQGWIGWFYHKFREASLNSSVVDVNISGDGKQVRDILYVSDVVTLYERIMLHSSSISGSIFNIGGGPTRSLSLIEYFDLLSKKFGIEYKVNHQPKRQGDQKVFIADTRSVQSRIGWFPTIDITEGISQLGEDNKARAFN